MAKRLDIKCFIERSNVIHHNKYDYSKVEYVALYVQNTVNFGKHQISI